MLDSCRAFGPWPLGPCAWRNNMVAGMWSRQRSSHQTGRRGGGEEGKKETAIPSICPSDLLLPSRSQLPEIAKPPKIASPAGDQTFKPRVWGRHDCYMDHNRHTDMVGLLIHFLSSNTGETLQVNLAWGTKWLNGLFVSLCPSCYSFDFQRPDRGH